MKLLNFAWRKIFPVLQVILPKYRDLRIFKIINKSSIIFHECYENKNYNMNTNGEKDLLTKLAKTENLKLIFDIGANRGDYSILSRDITSKAKIFAFEPVFDTFEFLISNTKNKDIKAYNFAFGKVEGVSKINLYGKDSLSSMLSFQNNFLNKPFKSIDINVRTGNSFLEENSDIKEISLLKIDTEGFENQVLEGFNKFLGIINVIQFEYGLANLASKYFLFDYFRDYSNLFKIGKIYPSGVIFFDEYNLEYENFIGPNLIMIRKDRADILKLLSLKKTWKINWN